MTWETNQVRLNCLRVEDLFSNIFEDGAIFHKAASGENELANFLTQLGINKDISIDLEYVFNHSGKKLISEFVLNLLKRDGAEISQDFTLSEQSYKWLENTIANRFLKKWRKLLDTLDIDFDPINPYEMKIEESTTDELDSQKLSNSNLSQDNSDSHSETRDHTDKSQRDLTGNSNETRDVTDNSERNGTINVTENETFDDKQDGTSETNVFGYNSTEAVKDSTETRSSSENSTRQNTSENTNNDMLNRTEKTTVKSDKTDSDVLDRTEKHTIESTDSSKQMSSRDGMETYHRSNPTTRELTRQGNIGNTSRQELIAQQREMLQWQFWNVVFDDVDTVLTRGMF